MRKAYIILAHKNIDQVLRLLQRLDDEASYFFVHIDKKVPNEELFQLEEFSGNLNLIERINTEWAAFNLVQATLNGLKAVKETGIPFDMISLISGQDYPIKNEAFIREFYSTTDKRVFMEHYTLPNYSKWANGGGLYRLNKYFFGLRLHERYMAKAANFLAMFLPLLRRKFPSGLTPYAGSQWWTIDMYALDYILAFVAQHPAYAYYHRYTFAPDELFFQTILLNASDERLLSGISNNNKRFMIWLSTNHSHPEVLVWKNMHDIAASDAFFARKFDLYADAGIFDSIDRHCFVNDPAQAAETSVNMPAG